MQTGNEFMKLLVLIHGASAQQFSKELKVRERQGEAGLTSWLMFGGDLQGPGLAVALQRSEGIL